MRSVAVAMTCHNRKSTTVQCLRTLDRQFGRGSEFELQLFLVDDGSTDGTRQAVKEVFPDAEVITGSGKLYWSGGMSLALDHARASNPDFTLWLNDDVDLQRNAVSEMLRADQAMPGSQILVGATRYFDRAVCSYSGANRRNPRRATSLEAVEPAQVGLTKVEAFNGNIVLVPREIYQRVGSVDARFVHSYGDIDYGLRAKSMGMDSYLMPGYLGFCDGRVFTAEWEDPELSRLKRLRLLFGKKSVPVLPHLRFLVRHSGALGLVWFIGTYLKGVAIILAGAKPGTLKGSASTEIRVL